MLVYTPVVFKILRNQSFISSNRKSQQVNSIQRGYNKRHFDYGSSSSNGNNISGNDDNYITIVVSSTPAESTVKFFIDEIKKYHITDIVHVCEKSYDDHIFKDMGVVVHDMSFPDGTSAPHDIIKSWLQLCKTSSCVAIHCVAGLGRAPMMVTILLIELGMSPLDAIEHVRNQIRGSLNTKQINFLIDYKRQNNKNKCIIC